MLFSGVFSKIKSLKEKFISSKKEVICFLGPPGSGKGTQISKIKELLSNTLIVRHFAPGQEMRAKGILNASGELADDSVINQLFDDAIGEASHILILDGYPRSDSQAQHLKQYLAKHHLSLNIFILNISCEEIIKRLAQRVVCPNCHDVASCADSIVCTKCNVKMIVRADDSSTIKICRRYTIYNQMINSILTILKEYSKTSVYNFDASNTVEVVYQEIESNAKNIITK